MKRSGKTITKPIRFNRCSKLAGSAVVKEGVVLAECFVIINLQEHYDHHKQDYFVKVAPAVAQLLRQLKREENNRLRKIRYHRAYYSLEMEPSIAARMPTPEEQYLQQQERDSILDAIAQLTVRQQQHIYSKFYLGYNHVEMARQGQIDEKVVRRSLIQALRILNRLLK